MSRVMTSHGGGHIQFMLPFVTLFDSQAKPPHLPHTHKRCWKTNLQCISSMFSPTSVSMCRSSHSITTVFLRG